ncbi:MAG: lipopolysaccharide transport periplasmic protein LptA [Desulfuromonadaceae bacterium]
MDEETGGHEEVGRKKSGQVEKINHDSSHPVDITSDSLDVDDKRGVFVFRGDVVAKQDNATIYSDRLSVFYTSPPTTKDDTDPADTQDRSIEKIVALGSVRIVQEGRIATGEHAEYLYTEGSVILTGSPKVMQGDNTIAGEKITVYLDGASSTVEGSSRERVKATFVPDDDESK